MAPRGYSRRAFLAASASIGAGSFLSGCLATASEVQFEDVSAEKGFQYESRLPPGGIANNGRQGVYVNDFDGDGWPDVLVVGGEPRSPMLFENDGGTFRPAEVLPPEVTEADLTFKSALFFDHDNDGWEDLVLFPLRSEPIFLENREGRFRVREVGLEDQHLKLPLGATALDYDGDGRLDLFVIQSGDWKDRVPIGFDDRDGSINRASNDGSFDDESRGSRNFDGTVREDNGNPNYLFRNTGSGFERVDDAGIDGEHWSLAASAADLTGNGLPDVHVANDFYSDVIYLNRGDGTFELTHPEATNRNGMSSAIGDLTGDGNLDIFVTNIHLDPADANSDAFKRYIKYRIGKRADGNNLLVNQGDGSFVDRGKEFGVEEGAWGWAAVLADFDNDGSLDVFHTTQLLQGVERREYFGAPRFWERTDDGFERRDATELGFAVMNGRGAAAIDYDRDGCTDLVVADLNGPYRLYENASEAGRFKGDNGWLQVRVAGTSDCPAIGARVHATTDGDVQVREVTSGTDFLSQSTRVLHFGLGGRGSVDELRVRWPDGVTRTFEDVEANRRLVVSRDGIEPAPN